MEEKIDLRPYLQALIANWFWIVGAGILTAIVAYVVASFVPKPYEATSLVVVTDLRQVSQFEPRIETTTDEKQPLKAFPELAKSDSVLTALLDSGAFVAEDIENINQLRSHLIADAGEDPSLIQLIVEYEDPVTARRIANEWARQFVIWTNEVYGSQSNALLLAYQTQLSQAADELAVANTALFEFAGVNRSDIVNNEVEAYLSEQANFLATRQSVTKVKTDVQSLLNYMEAQPENVPITFADQLSALALQLKSFSANNVVSLDLSADSLQSFSDISRDELTTTLNTLIEILNRELTLIDEHLVELEPQILNTQQELRRLNTEFEELTESRDLAAELHTALARQIGEELINSRSINEVARLASEATVPTIVSTPSKLVIGVLAGTMGMLVAAFVIILITWWRESDIMAAAEEQPQTTF